MTCTPKQIQILFRYAEVNTQEVAAAKAGMALSTAKRYLRMGASKNKKSRNTSKGRTRNDPFAGVWEEVKELLAIDSGLEAKTLMEFLIESYPDRFTMSHARTLRRRVHDWRVLEGPERKEVMFLQNIQPGRQSQSDYTHCNELFVTIDGLAFPHMLYHFMLPFSRWEYAWICFSESFETLTEGFARAVELLGAVAPEHRTDNLAAAVPVGGHGQYQIRWSNFLEHYDCRPSSNNPEKSNENGSVEKSHDLLKKAIDQRLRLRKSRDFKSREDYNEFVQKIVAERNRTRKDKLEQEKPLLNPLPARGWNEPQQASAAVTAWSTVRVMSATYSVPSRYIGQKLKALVFFDRVEMYYGNHLIERCPRKNAGEKHINYRHLIFHLLRKPGAFRNYQFRDELFPQTIFRKAYDALLEWREELADREYLKVLNQAAMESEADVAAALMVLLEQGETPNSEKVRQLCSRRPLVPKVTVLQPDLSKYDNLLTFEPHMEKK